MTMGWKKNVIEITLRMKMCSRDSCKHSFECWRFDDVSLHAIHCSFFTSQSVCAAEEARFCCSAPL